MKGKHCRLSKLLHQYPQKVFHWLVTKRLISIMLNNYMLNIQWEFLIRSSTYYRQENDHSVDLSIFHCSHNKYTNTKKYVYWLWNNKHLPMPKLPLNLALGRRVRLIRVSKLFAITSPFCIILIYITPLTTHTPKWTQMNTKHSAMKHWESWIYWNCTRNGSSHLKSWTR